MAAHSEEAAALDEAHSKEGGGLGPRPTTFLRGLRHDLDSLIVKGTGTSVHCSVQNTSAQETHNKVHVYLYPAIACHYAMDPVIIAC